MKNKALSVLRALPLLALLLTGACALLAPSDTTASAEIEKARAALVEGRAIEKSSPEAAELVEYAADLVEQSEAALARGDTHQAVLAAQLAVEKVKQAKQEVAETMESAE